MKRIAGRAWMAGLLAVWLTVGLTGCAQKAGPSGAEHPSGNQPAAPASDHPQGEHPAAVTPQQGQPQGEHPAAATPQQEHPQGEHPSGEDQGTAAPSEDSRN